MNQENLREKVERKILVEFEVEGYFLEKTNSEIELDFQYLAAMVGDKTFGSLMGFPKIISSAKVVSGCVSNGNESPYDTVP